MDLRQTANLVLLLRTLVIDLHAKNKRSICKGIWSAIHEKGPSDKFNTPSKKCGKVSTYFNVKI